MENLSENKDINRVYQNLAKESLDLQEMKQHKPRFAEECLVFLYQRKQTKMQWVQDPSQNNVHNLNNVRHEASRHFMNKK